MRDGLLRAHGQIWGEWYHFPGRITLLGSNPAGLSLSGR